MARMVQARTLSELRSSGYVALPVREEMRKNLIEKIRRKEELFQGILGYEETAIPQIENAILSGHDMIFLGERGQAKSRLIRHLINFLDPYIPTIIGCEINDSPFSPICKRCRDLVAEKGDEVELQWIPREKRYGEKLATPDVSIADLIGEVDPIKVAEGKYLSDELTIHFGLIPRTHRGIFAINELPDLAEKVQVGLFNIMEERDIQIKGYRLRLPLDVFIVASANPEDYTSRGRIITPLKDRFRSQIRTHYPMTRELEVRIMDQEKKWFPMEGYEVKVPKFMKEIVAEMTMLARKSREVNQRSGVSVRMAISNYENLLSSAEKRALRLGEREIAPRISDLSSLRASSLGKMELEYGGEERSEGEFFEKLLKKTVKEVFDGYCDIEFLKDVVDVFNRGAWMEVSDLTPSRDYLEIFREVRGLKDIVKGLGVTEESPALLASAIEFILEGLHLHNLLNKDVISGKIQYKGSLGRTIQRAGREKG